MNKQGKRILTLGIALAGLTVCGNSFMQGWSPTRGDDKKIPNFMTAGKDTVTFCGAEKRNWIFFNPQPAAASRDDKVEIQFTVSGTGKLKIGFFAYVSAWKSCGSAWKDYELTAEPKKVVMNFSVPARAGIVRSAITILPGAKAVFHDYQFRVIKNGNPQLNVSASSDRPDAIYSAGEKAFFTATVRSGSEIVKAGQAFVRISCNGKWVEKTQFDLSRENPFKVAVSSREPGFVLAYCDLKGIPGQKDKTGIQIGGAAFSPEKIRAASASPADLVSYWKSQYQKLEEAVPANVQKTKVKDNGRFTIYHLTADYYQGKKIFATLTVPHGKGPFPMVFTVPPAGNTIFTPSTMPGMIRLTVSVHHNPDYAKWKAYEADNQGKKGWYFYRNEGTRESFFYYRAILGVMRMMDYAMKEVKEWDGKHLAAVGRSQGGGFAFIMTALNPRIQAVAADVPALCDHEAGKLGRKPGWPQLLNHSSGKKMAPHAAYFDAANFAAVIQCPALVTVGFIDTMCVPTSVYAAYNNLKGPKKMLNAPEYGHGWGKRSFDFEQESAKFLKQTFEKQK